MHCHDVITIVVLPSAISLKYSVFDQQVNRGSIANEMIRIYGVSVSNLCVRVIVTDMNQVCVRQLFIVHLNLSLLGF